MKIPTWYINEGRFTHLGGLLTAATGLFITFFSIAFMPYVWLRYTGMVIGVTITAIAGYEVQARGLKLPAPFTRDPLGWRKAKASYKKEANAEEKTDKP